MTVQEREDLQAGKKLRTQYYVDKTPESSGERLVHQQGCRHCPRGAIYLGSFSSPREALRKARRYYILLAPCARCCGKG